MIPADRFSAPSPSRAGVKVIIRAIGHLDEVSVGVSSATTEQAAVTRDMSASMQSAASRTMERITLSTGAVGTSVAKVALAARALV